MKVKNFPGNKNKRRISAASRLATVEDHSIEKVSLVNSIMPQEVAERIRTKKNRADRNKEKSKHE
jgi:hypothetical protein